MRVAATRSLSDTSGKAGLVWTANLRSGVAKGDGDGLQVMASALVSGFDGLGAGRAWPQSAQWTVALVICRRRGGRSSQ